MQYKAEKISKSNQSIATQKAEEFKNGQWSELPSIPLENIYSFLEHKDQVNLSLVCHNWSEGYSLPSVWKNFKFAFTKLQLSMDTCPVMKLAHKYNNMFQNVVVGPLFIEDQRVIQIWSSRFIEFLQILTENSQLISINFSGLSSCLRKVDKSAYDDICTSIANFLESQHQLKQVIFCHSCFRFPEGVEILKKLFLHNRKSLTKLNLLYFFRNDRMAEEQISNIWQNLPTITDLPNLKILETDYSFIFENMVLLQSRTVKNCLMLSLSKIILFYENCMVNRLNFRGFTSRDWQFLKKLSPILQVEMRIVTNSPSRQELKFLIVPHMPIVSLEYRCEDSDMRMENDQLFRYLLECKTNDHLVSLYLGWLPPVQCLVSHLIPFLSACKKLKFLEIDVYYPSNILDMMEYWLNNRPEYLEKVYIRVVDSDYIDEETFITLQNSTSNYVSQLEMIGMNVYVDLDE